MGSPNLIGYRYDSTIPEEWFLVFSPSIKEAMSGAHLCRINSLMQLNFIGESPNDLWKRLKEENDPKNVEFFSAGPTLTLRALALGIKNSSDLGDISNLETLIPVPRELISDGDNRVILQKKEGKWILYTDQDYIETIINNHSLEEEFVKGNILLDLISDKLFYRLTQVKEGLDVKKAVSTVTMRAFIRDCNRRMKENSTWDDVLRRLNPAITE